MNKKNKLQEMFFFLPAFSVLAIFVIISMLFVFFLSFFKVQLDYSGGVNITYIALDNYKRMFSDVKFIAALGNTFDYAIVVVPAQVCISLVLASILGSKLRGKNIFRTIYFLPTLTSSAALTLIFMFLFSATGPVNQFLLGNGNIDEAIIFFDDVDFALGTIKLMNIWSTVPFLMTIFLAGIVDIDEAMYESASIDGAGAIRKFFKITVPSIKPVITFVVLISVVGTLQVFDQAYIVSDGSGGPANSTLTLSLMIYQYAFDPALSSMGYAAAISVILGLVIFTFSQLIRFVNRKEGM